MKSVFIARMLASIYLSLAVGLLFSRSHYEKEFEKMLNNASVLFLGGMFTIAFGFITLSCHSSWDRDMKLFYTLVGWGSVIKGEIMLAFPWVTSFYKPLYTPKALRMLVLPMLIIFGGFSAYLGFFY